MLFSLVLAESAWFITNLDADKLKKFFFEDLDNNTGITPLRLLTCKYVGDGAASESYCDINIQRKGFPLRPVEKALLLR